jgi:phosphoglycolate phosphatase
LSSPLRYRLVVFDWDGTIVDSIGSIVACTQAAMLDAGVEAPPEPVLRGAIGLGLEDSFARFFPDSTRELREHILERYRHHWIETFHARHDPFPDVVATLTTLHAQGVLVAVATAKSRRGLVRDLERTGLGAWIHASRTLDECPPKPSPAMLLELMEELGTRPRDTLMVGDTRWDLEMARNAGTDAVAVLCGAHAPEELALAPAAARLAHVGELPAWMAAACIEAT